MLVYNLSLSYMYCDLRWSQYYRVCNYLLAVVHVHPYLRLNFGIPLWLHLKQLEFLKLALIAENTFQVFLKFFVIQGIWFILHLNRY